MPSSPPDSPLNPSIALPASDPLAQLDAAFHDTYARRRDATLASMGPMLAQIEDSLILRLRGQRLEGPARTRRYHELKAMSHVPITIYLLLGAGAASVDESTGARVKALRQQIETVMAELGSRLLEGEALERQRRLLEQCAGFLDAVLASRTASGLAEFLRTVTPLIIANMQDAARDQLETMHATLGEWMRTMTANERSALQAVVAVSHMSRPGNVGVQYLSVALGERWEGRFDQEDLEPGRRVIASEVTTDEEAALSLLATHELDARVAASFFHDAARMDRDLLADAAERILCQMFGRAPEGA